MIVSFKNVFVKGPAGESNPGQMRVTTRSFADRIKNNLKKYSKTYTGLLALTVLALVIHLLIPIALLSWLIITGVFFWTLNPKYRVVFDKIDSECPKCKVSRELKPYLNARVEFPTVCHCDACGQRFNVVEAL